MSAPEDNRNVTLLGGITLVCAAVAGIAWPMPPTQPTSGASVPPFVPNTNPRER